MRTGRTCNTLIVRWTAAVLAITCLTIICAAQAPPPQSGEQPAAAASQESERAWIERARKTAEQMTDSRIKSNVLQEVLGAHAKFGDVDAARQMMDVIDPQNRQWALATIAAGQAERGDIAAAKQFAQSLKDKEVKPGSSRWLIAGALARTGDLQGALQVLDGSGSGRIPSGRLRSRRRKPATLAPPGRRRPSCLGKSRVANRAPRARDDRASAGKGRRRARRDRTGHADRPEVDLVDLGAQRDHRHPPPG